MERNRGRKRQGNRVGKDNGIGEGQKSYEIERKKGKGKEGEGKK